MMELIIVALMLAFGLGLMLQWWQTIWQAEWHRLVRADHIHNYVGNNVCLETRAQSPEQHIVSGQQSDDYSGRWQVGHWRRDYQYHQHLCFVREAICSD